MSQDGQQPQPEPPIMVHYTMESTIVQGEHKQHLAFKGIGKLADKGAFRYLRYQEREKDSGAVTAVIFKIISPEMVQITRMGAARTRMVFRKGQETESVFATPHGTNIFKTNVRNISVIDDEDGTKVDIFYELSDGTEKIGDYEVHLHYWPQEN